MSGGATRKAIHAVAAIPIVVLVSLSSFAAYVLGDTPRIPMHWNKNWEPTMYAPILIGLSIIPAMSFIVIGSFLTSIHHKTEHQQIRYIIIIGCILIACHVFHLYIVNRWLTTSVT